MAVSYCAGLVTVCAATYLQLVHTSPLELKLD